MPFKKIFELLGWVGTFFIILAYFMVSFSFINPNELIFQFLNLFGALGLILTSYQKKNMQPVLLNIFWGALALISIIKIIYF